ncbi:UNVERIFIED_CONTAM: hypothetical protein FKN15_078254 [Acipenser sinensis]
MNVGVAHSEVNPNTRVMNSRGIWVAYLILVAVLHVVLLSIPFFSVPLVWTLTNVIHNLVMYLFLHTVKGTPFETPDQGKARLLTHWEQMDYGVQFTSSRKFLTISPIVLPQRALFPVVCLSAMITQHHGRIPEAGGSPTPFDRNYGTKLGVKAVLWMTDKLKETYRQGRVFADAPETACMVGMRRKVLSFNPVTELKEHTDFEHRMPKEQWWLNLRPMLKMLAKYPTNFNEYVTGEIEHVTRRSLSIETGF